MLELPEKMRAGIGLQARKFKSRDTGEVDSSWTETPADKERRQKVSHESMSSLYKIPLPEKAPPTTVASQFHGQFTNWDAQGDGQW